MTDEQIIKALECCEASENKCDDCPFYGVKEDCEVELPEEALDLIKRQNNLIEQLGNDVNRKYNLLCKMEEILRNLKSEAIKEFAERLKSRLRFYYQNQGMLEKEFYLLHIDKAVKEMTEEK